MVRLITRKSTKKSNGLIAFTAMAGLLLQMAWATAHYPMLLANLGTTESGVSVSNLVICVHRAKQQRIFAALNKNQSSPSTTPAQSTQIQSEIAHSDQPVEPVNNQNAPSDELCTFSIALTGADIATGSSNLALQTPITSSSIYRTPLLEKKLETRSFLASLGRSPPA